MNPKARTIRFTSVFGQWRRSTAALAASLWLACAVFSVANAQPRVTTQPSGRMIALGGSVTLRVAATGTLPIGFQWSFNGLEIPGATNTSLVLTNIQRAQAGEYLALASNADGSATSLAARLDVYVRTGIFDIGDPVEFDKILSTNATVTRMATLDSWIEGVVWIPSDGGYLVFSDIGNDRLKKLAPPNTLTDFLRPPANTKYNGNLLDLHERLISCLAGSAGLKVTVMSNSVSVPLLTQYTNGAKFYSPNDLAIKSDGSIWFTDPGYDSGLALPSGASFPRGFQPGLYVYRFFQTNGNATVQQVVTNMSRPNGICLSPDETKLYLADTANTPGIIRAFDVTRENTVTGGAILCTVGDGVPDGIKSDAEGRIWSSAGDGVEVFAPDGRMIARIRLTRTANLCFGGPEYKTLYMVGQPYVSSIPVRVPGAVARKKLAVAVSGNQINVAWPAPSSGFKLQATGSLSGTAAWRDVEEAPAVIDGLNAVSVKPTDAARFFRLQLK